MSAYTIYNLSIAGLVFPLSFWLVGPQNRRRKLLRSMRIALLMAVIGYPWDFFAITLGVWGYPLGPGPRIYAVPINDLWFISLCTLLACSALTGARRWQPRYERHPKREHASKQNTRNH
jgi:lycopene cyclase domain-containing protein